MGGWGKRCRPGWICSVKSFYNSLNTQLSEKREKQSLFESHVGPQFLVAPQNNFHSVAPVE